MFKRKIQCKCGKKVDPKYSFCPFCGYPLRKQEHQQEQAPREREPDNLFDALDENFKMPFLLKLPFKKIVRDIEKQFREMDKSFNQEENQKEKNMKIRPENMPKVRPNVMPNVFSNSQGISISIGGSKDGRPIIRVKKFAPNQAGQIREMQNQNSQNNNQGTEKEEPEQRSMKKITKAEKARLEKFAKLPREEPETNIRRLSNKIIYEILIPGIKDKKNIIINKLKNSIEIKAFTKDKAYFKLIPLSLPIQKHYLEKGKLVLELNPNL